MSTKALSVFELFVKNFKELNTEELYEILKVRFAVFVMEQHCFYLDMDDIDYRATHIFLRHRKEVVAYARLFAGDGAGVWHIGRVLTTRRGKGFGLQLMKEIIMVAREREAILLRMDAQTYVTGFYEKFGFKITSEEFEEVGIMHKKMELSLK